MAKNLECDTGQPSTTRRRLVADLLGVAAATAALAACSAKAESAEGLTEGDGRIGDGDGRIGATGSALSTRTVEDIATLRASNPVAGEVVTVLGYYEPGDGGGGLFVGEPTSTAVDNGGTIIAPASGVGRWRRAYSGPLSVKYFGARDNGTNPTVTRQAIQKAIDTVVALAADGSAAAGTAGVIYFPSRAASPTPTTSRVAEYAVDGDIVLPRHPFLGEIVLRGDGRRVVQITRKDAGTLFRPDPSTSNLSSGFYLFEHLSLAVQGDSRVLDWDVPGLDLTRYGRPHIHFNEVLFATGNSEIEGLVRLRGGHRCRFYNCEFYGLSKSGGTTYGVAVWLDTCGETTMINCRQIATPGSLLKVTQGGVTAINCRSEGGKNRPAWHFENARNVTLINPANEGEHEDPAIFYFKGCKDVVVINPQLATGDGPNQSGRYPDGMRFEACEACTVLDPLIGIAFNQADAQARAIRIDAACKYVVVKGGKTTALSIHDDVVNQGTDCYVELQTANGLQAVGTEVGDSLRVASAAASTLSLSQVSAAPAPPATGGTLFVDGGSLKFMKPNGTVVTIVP